MSEDGKWFYTSMTARRRDRSQIVSIKTGIDFIDKKIIGLNKKELSVFSGFRAAGKSTILTQIALQVVHEGKRVALFSGEMDESRVFDWTYLIASGRSYTLATQYENYFEIQKEVIYPIKKWLDQKMFVYNNNYGNDIDGLFDKLKYCVEAKGVDIIILDNLMSIDIGATDKDKNSKQTSFIWRVKHFAEDNDVHIILVAHPRKCEAGILRIDDISGTADLTNAADNVFLLHRVTFDFKRCAKALFRWPDEHELLSVHNILEVAKNRDLGVVDEMAGLIFDRRSKQMSCDGSEICYGWRETINV